MPARPNLLLIMTDQHRGDSLSLAGHPAVLTPNIDALGLEGAHFQRAYATCPSCIPARRALLTGQYPATNGLGGFVGHPITTAPTLPQALHDAGYQTELVGRTMHQEPPYQRYGYDHMTHGSSYVPQDVYADWLAEQAPGSGGVRGAGLSFNGWTARPWPLADHLHPTAWIVEEGKRFLRHARDASCPLFLTLSFYAPHPPLVPPAFYLDRYLRVPLPDPYLGEWATPPAHHLVDSARVNLLGEALRAARAGYYGLINHVDDQLYWFMQEFIGLCGREGREWLVVFTSDHGEMLGDHYYFRKCEPYEGSARIPLLIRGSSGFGINTGMTSTAPVCLEDVMPTLLDAAGASIPDGLDGRSLLPLLRGERDRVRDVLPGEHAPCYSKEQAFHSLTDGRWKYIWRPFTGAEQLFDLETDPGECRDLAAAQPDATAHWRRRLIDWLHDRPEGFTDGARLIEPREYPGIISGVGCTA